MKISMKRKEKKYNHPGPEMSKSFMNGVSKFSGRNLAKKNQTLLKLPSSSVVNLLQLIHFGYFKACCCFSSKILKKGLHGTIFKWLAYTCKHDSNNVGNKIVCIFTKSSLSSIVQHQCAWLQQENTI